MSSSTTTQPQSVIVSSIVDLEASTPGICTADKLDFPISDLFCCIEKAVDFESLRLNGMGEIKELIEKQGLSMFFDILNGPVYPNLVKDFWMKAEVVSKGTFLAAQSKEEKGKTSGFLGQEVRSEIGGVCVRIRAEHIRQALRLPFYGLILRMDEKEPNPLMQEEIYCK
jgi:hypothetical protein